MLEIMTNSLATEVEFNVFTIQEGVGMVVRLGGISMARRGDAEDET
jgi:hypothetical protein